MKAVVMAGGEGTRLRPLTVNQPKPMLPVVNRPLAEHVLHLLRRHGFDDVVVTVAYLANAIRTYFGTGAEFGVRMVYATEESPLGTAGSVRHAQAELRERFLVISGDVLTDVDLGALLRFHESTGAVATLALKPMDNPLEFGIVITDDAGRIVRFLEKPTWGQVFSDTVNTGIYVLEPEVLDWIPAGRPADFAAEVFPAMLEAGLPLYGWVTERYWEDVGTLEAYLRAHQDALDGRVALDVPGFPVRPGVFVGEGAEVDTAATVVGPAVVGPNCRVGAGAVLGPYTVLGANVRIGEGARLERCVLHDNTYVAPGADLAGCVVGRSCDVRRGARLEEGVVLGDECHIGAHAVLTPGVKVYPHKTVESGAVVTSSIVWETRGARSLFGSLGVTGLANVDLSPEVAVRVALAYASLLPKGSTVTVSRDSSRAARMLKRAAMVGITAAGCSVEDLEVATVPVTRFQVRTGASRGGLTVRLVRGDPQSVVLRFLDEGGLDLDEQTQRKVDRLYHREEARRVLAAEIGDIDFPPRTLELYTAELAGTVDLEAIRRSRFKLVLDYAHGSACFVMPNVLSKLGAEVLAVNPHISTPGVLSFDRDRHARHLGELVRSSGAHLGAVIDPDGEQLTLVDDTGAVLDDETALLAFVALVGEAMPGVEVAVPVVASREVELLARRVGARLVWAKISAGGLLEAAVREQVGFAGSTWGGFVFPDFLPAYDAVASLLQLLGLLARRRVRLSELVGGLARPRVAHREVPTPLDHKGLVMRVVLERAKGEDVVLVDGVKVADEGGWTLVVPDAERPVTHVYAEGASAEASESRAALVAAQVASIAAGGEVA
jgi:mannose-1-phosphate guanylyltransferase/phosphomannomutase